MIRIGSAFSGIGGFEVGLEKSIPDSKTVWQIEQNSFCQKVLRKHWPDSKIYDDVREVGAHNLEPVDIFCAGFPCQDISLAGKGEGLDGKKSGLWWECFRIISELRPRIIVLENVAAITFRGGREVVGSLAQIGYDTEWQVISARMFGAPHLRRRWFCVGYTSDTNSQSKSSSTYDAQTLEGIVTNSNSTFSKRNRSAIGVQQRHFESNMSLSEKGKGYWKKTSPVSPLCGVDDGIPDRLDRLRALGNAIVPQCSEYIGKCIVGSGLL
tara:strand:- start:555 stop:1358 length:804 start_codon:yes stop_codon:yes gene_type:complete